MLILVRIASCVPCALRHRFEMLSLTVSPDPPSPPPASEANKFYTQHSASAEGSSYNTIDIIKQNEGGEGQRRFEQC